MVRLWKVSILITCEYLELFSISVKTNGGIRLNELREVKNTRVKRLPNTTNLPWQTSRILILKLGTLELP
ncbi:hypothetical protein KM043_008654 [Ampulex compressa]|nr:hypothetical protein KM043_008654 [Ampulex compressa]